MYKGLYFSIAIILAFINFSNAQTSLPNMDFEQWEENHYSSWFPNNFYWECLPTSTWSTGNSASTTLNQFPTYRTTDAKSGNYAACMETLNLFNVPAAGTLFTGTFVANMFESKTYFGVPFTGKPDAFQGWYKYTPGTYNNANDTAAIYAILSKWNGSSRVEIARAELYPNTNVSQYTFFNLEFNYVNNLNPDTITVVFASSKNGEIMEGGIGSKLFIDDIDFYYNQTSSQITKLEKQIKILYNNRDKFITITRSTNTEGVVELYNITGKKIQVWNINDYNNDLLIGKLAQGIYICKYVASGDKPFVTKIYID